MLAQWWEKKYQLPSNHNLFQERTLESLLTEFWADVYAKNPLEAHRQEDGEIQLKNTGDPYIDKWEEELAQGLVPDYEEMFTEEQMAYYRRIRTQHQDTAKNYELQEAANAAAASHPVTRQIREYQEAQTQQGRFQTFGDD